MDSIASAFSLYKLLEIVVVNIESSCEQALFELISIVGVVYGRHTCITFLYLQLKIVFIGSIHDHM